MKMTFEEWMDEVKVEMMKRYGLSPDDLPDCYYADWYEDGVRPSTAARRAISEAM